MPSQWEDEANHTQHRVYRSHVTTESPPLDVFLDSGHIEEHVIEKNEKLAAEPVRRFRSCVRHGRTQGRAERGITIDVAHKEFFTPDYYWTIIDAPGHRDFVKNMITGASADTAVLCAANDGVNAQTKEHAFLAKVLVSRVIVHVNKMDISMSTGPRSTTLHARKSRDCSRWLDSARRRPHDPCIVLNGDNVFNKSDKCPCTRVNPLQAINATQCHPSHPQGTRLPIRCLQDLRYRYRAWW